MHFSVVHMFTTYLSLVTSPWSSRPRGKHQNPASPFHVSFRPFSGTLSTSRRPFPSKQHSFRQTVQLASTVGEVFSTSTVDATLVSSVLLALEAIVSSVDNLHKIQRLGENLFAGILSVALLQGVVALGQYRTNPSGQLVVPPGRTIGVAYHHSKTNENNKVVDVSNTAERVLMNEGVGAIALLEDVTDVTPAMDVSTHSTANSSPAASASEPTNINTNPTTTTATTSATSISRYARTLNQINKWLVLLVPWAGRQLSFLLSRNTHLLHLGFIIVFSRIFDLPHSWAFRLKRLKRKSSSSSSILQYGATANTTAALSGGSAAVTDMTALHPEEHDAAISRPIRNLLVLGDSLAVGLGSVDVFDVNRNNTLDYALIQNVQPETTAGYAMNQTGPIFPRVLAESLAEKEGVDVSWRSAGVDGGNAGHVLEFCLDVLQEEVDQGRVPQLVVLLVGINDLKLYMSKPWWGGNPGPRAFRKRLRTLIDSIQTLAPKATIVLPAIPTQMFHKNSPMNIFPFNFVMDSLIGFWDSLKMGVVDRVLDGEDTFTASSSSDTSTEKKGRVVYIRMEPKEVLKWYNMPNPLGEPPAAPPFGHRKEEGLIAADGVHPNAKCYALWAKSLADQLLP